jgi:hypothetical protein
MATKNPKTIAKIDSALMVLSSKLLLLMGYATSAKEYRRISGGFDNPADIIQWRIVELAKSKRRLKAIEQYLQRHRIGLFNDALEEIHDDIRQLNSIVGIEVIGIVG